MNRDFMSLQGKRVVVTRSGEQADNLAEQLRRLGAVPVIFPTIQLVPLPADSLTAVLPHLAQYDWLIFTSANAVEFFFRNHPPAGSEPAGGSTLPPIAVGGPATAEKLHSYGVEPAFMPEEFVGEALVAGLGDLTGKRVLFPRAKIGRPEIPELLREQGAIVDEIALYDTVTADPSPEAIAELANGFDAITFTSPSSVRHFLKILEDIRPDVRSLWNKAIIACIGPITAEQTTTLGLPVHVMPTEYTTEGLVQALATHFQVISKQLSVNSQNEHR